MNVSPDFLKRLHEARTLATQRRYSEAEVIYRQLISSGEAAGGLWGELFELYMAQNQKEHALDCLERLANSFPEKPEYWLRLAQLAQAENFLGRAIDAYRVFLSMVPDRPNTVFNFAYLLKRAGHLEEALEWYRKALQLNISGKEEVYSNMGVIFSELRREDEAKDYFQLALKMRGDYLPALLNLAGLQEEVGDKSSAVALYQRALGVDKNCCLALSRLANLSKAESSRDPLIQQISHQLSRRGLQFSEREELGFALGKLLDDCGRYEEAFLSYQAANKLGAKRFPEYEPDKHSGFIDSIVQTFSQSWFAEAHSSLTEDPIFICGMFRSGSTLLEQMLGGHSKITPGGELQFFPELVEGFRDAYPSAIAQKSVGYFEGVGREYLDFLAARFPQAGLVTDKRPDNFLNLGLIKSVFPRARIVWTRRGLLDNCLSVYFQQLGGGMNYSVDLDSIAHYLSEQERLMNHWQAIFPGSICEVSYERLVKNPRHELGSVLDFLGLQWEDACLDFSERKSHVKTASIWQVREPIHVRSSSRHLNYSSQLKGLSKYLKS